LSGWALSHRDRSSAACTISIVESKFRYTQGADNRIVFRSDDESISSKSAERTIPASSLGYIVEPNPVYPEDARRRGRQGNVMVRVLVDIDGRPAETVVQKSSGSDDLGAAAVTAVRGARFKPPVIDGKAEPVWVLVPINFVLKN
jgi:protein TonB